MKFIPIILIIAIGVTLMDHSYKRKSRGKKCLVKCPDYLLPQGICASDGEIYTDECRAKCKNRAYESVFPCISPFNEAEKERCKEICIVTTKNRPSFYSCGLKCLLDHKKDPVCASDGNVYLSLCHLQCKDRQLYEIFTCGSKSKHECASSCKARVSQESCESKCPVYFSPNMICASDSELYMDICRAKCKNESLWEIMNCGSLSEFSCKQECNAKVKEIQCQTKCVAYPDNMPTFCATNGEVYDDFCKAKCLNCDIEFAWSCKQRGFLGNNRFFCAAACTKAIACKKTCVGSPYEAINGSNGVIYNSRCEAQCNGVIVSPVPIFIHPIIHPKKPHFIKPFSQFPKIQRPFVQPGRRMFPFQQSH